MKTGDIITILFFGLAMFSILYFTVGKAFSDFNKRFKNLVLKLVSAGSVEKTYSEAVVSISANNFQHNDETVNTDNYTLMVVDGNSMDRFGIKDGSVVMVDNDISMSYKDDTIFVLRINHRENGNKIEYKLRRAIDFYYCGNDDLEIFKVWVQRRPELNAKILYEKYATEQEKIEECRRLGCRLLISETTRNGRPYYSFHPETYIYGKVKYKVPKEIVKIIEKR